MRLLAGAAIVLAMICASARADDLVVYGAGSLRQAVGQIAAKFGQAHGINVQTQFGPSGRMRERPMRHSCSSRPIFGSARNMGWRS